MDLLVVPVSYSQSVLYLEYGNSVPPESLKRYKIPEIALSKDRHRLYGQQYIDKLPHPGVRLNVGIAKEPLDCDPPAANPEYLQRIRDAELFVMGAGSLIGSQLAQLVVPGVVDVLIERQDIRKILVLNHVKMDETLGMSLRDQIKLIETAASHSVSPTLLQTLARPDNQLRISDLFTDIVVARTVAREIEQEMEIHENPEKGNAFVSSDISSKESQKACLPQSTQVLCNRYVSFLTKHPEICSKLGITMREIEVLTFLEQPPDLEQKRFEAGRYRGAMFATDADLKYLVGQGIQLRSIHEVDSIGENWKFVKAEGSLSLEFFPGLVPEALLGIFRIALERTRSSILLRGNPRLSTPR